MDEKQHREQLFYSLRQALKAQGYTYARLAEALDVSELTVKRLFRDKDCKMSRLIEICSVIGLSVADLAAMQERRQSDPYVLSPQTEAGIAEDPNLFALFVLLISQVNPADIAEKYQLSDSRLYRYLRVFEQLEVLDILENNQIRLRIPLPIRIRFDGPLGESVKKINQQFIGLCVEQSSSAEYTFSTSSRLMRLDSIRRIQEQLEQLQKEVDYLATQDQLFYQHEELELYKVVYGLGPFPVLDIFRKTTS